MSRIGVLDVTFCGVFDYFFLVSIIFLLAELALAYFGGRSSSSPTFASNIFLLSLGATTF